MTLALAACGDDSRATDSSDETTSEGETTAGGSTSADDDDDDDDGTTTTGDTTAGPDPSTTTEDPSTTTGDPTTDPSTTGEPLMITALRWNSMKIEDPHFFALGCNLDITDMVNTMLMDAVTMDGDDPPDGSLDLNFVMLFPDPLDVGDAGGDMDLAVADTCLVPLAAPICSLGAGQTNPSAYTNDGSGCLAPDGNHLSYGLSTDPVPGPCFTSDTIASLDISLGDFVLPLRDVEISATYDGDPVAGAVNGIMRGFLTETDAENTTLPDDLPVVGGNSIASLVCKPNDKDDNNGEPGWWFYVTFTANKAKWNG
ncbi:MAG: hypothetical protein H6713_17725 [Myxococcales bacterium]|nr:hypothetical protein [Myxococcales bacterium]MCB9751817.1 hypothetical protein [Myxococcales bacterium]